MDTTMTRLDSSWANESVSHGTLQPEDVIPAMIGVLARVRPERASLLATQYANGDHDAMDVWDALEDCLIIVAPAGCYFGSHPGNTSDYGFWPVSLLDRDESLVA